MRRRGRKAVLIGDGIAYRDVRIELEEPLGGRALVDEHTGEEIGILPRAYRPEPDRVPPGFERSMSRGYTPENHFIAITQFRRERDGASLEFRTRSATAWGPSGRSLGSAVVDGHPATVTQESYQRCVTWHPGPGLVAEACSLGTFLAVDELIGLAQAVPPVR